MSKRKTHIDAIEENEAKTINKVDLYDSSDEEV